MADNPYTKYGNSHPYLKHRDDLADEKYAAIIVRGIFQEIKMRFGEETAVKMFAPYGRKLNNKDVTIWKNAGLIWKLINREEWNISALARELAGRGKNNVARAEALRQQISKALNDKAAVAEARELWEWVNDAKFDDYFRPPKPRRRSKRG